MHQLPRPALAALLSAALLTGCGHFKLPGSTVFLKTEYPPSVFQCQEAPPVPADNANDTEIAVFMALSWTAWLDCSERLAALAPGLVTQEGATRAPEPQEDPLGLGS